MIADVGLVGFPNVGKSTLVSILSNAKPEIANYEFTTLIPSLGIVNVSDYQSFVIADIPGIIGGASEGKGLGLEFLRHIERTRFLLFVLDLANYRTLEEQFTTLKAELECFSLELTKRPFGIMFSKLDTQSESLAEESSAESQGHQKRIFEFLKTFGFHLEKNEHSASFVQKNRRDFGVDYDLSIPLFALGVSSVSGENLESLRFLLYSCLKDFNV